MEYGRLKPQEVPRNQTQTRKCILIKYALSIIALLALVGALGVAIAIIVVIVQSKNYTDNKIPSSSSPPPPPSLESQLADSGGLAGMCRVTRYPDLCVESLGGHYYHVDGIGHGEEQISVVEVSLNVTLRRLYNALRYFEMEKKELDQVRDSLQWSAHDDCLELFEDSVDLLKRTQPLLRWLLSSSSTSTDGRGYDDQSQSYLMDLMTWMTTICTNHDTCTDGFEEAGGASKDQTAEILQDLSQIVSNHLILSSTFIKNDVVAGRKLMGLKPNKTDHNDLGSPKWLSRKTMMLLGSPLNDIQPNVTVSQDGIGPDNTTVWTIQEAIENAPKNSSTPFIIHVKAGRYQEANLTVGKSRTNIWLIGDGKGITIISGNRSVVQSNVTTSKTPTFGVTGVGFVARGITFENTAGPENNQAVALYVKSDQSVFYECEMKGYQDTLYVHSNRQFYRNCDIYGTVDFIFGNAQAVLQNCTLYSLKPLEKQKNTITAQKRSLTCPDSCSGISIHESQVRAGPDLEPVKSNYTTFLGRPWRELSTVVYMLSYIGDHVDPQGWSPWNATSLLDRVYYGEFMNHGPGSNTSLRIKSPGIHANMTVDEAARFTVERFVGVAWIAETRVPFVAGF